MTRTTAAKTIGPAALLAAVLLWAAPAQAAPVGTERAACTVVTARVATKLRRTRSSIPYCEVLRAVDSPRGHYVLALRGRCRERICGSTLIGWYAVEKPTGRVFEWDLRDGGRLGRPLGQRR